MRVSDEELDNLGEDVDRYYARPEEYPIPQAIDPADVEDLISDLRNFRAAVREAVKLEDAEDILDYDKWHKDWKAAMDKLRGMVSQDKPSGA